MDEIGDQTNGGFRGVELLTGPGRRRRWSEEEKARIVAETLAPGARVSEVARRWRLRPRQLFDWRRRMRIDPAGPAPKPRRCGSPAFVPIVAEAVTTGKRASSRAVIEIRLAGAVVRVASDTDLALLSEVLRAVRSSAARA
jgi:transposase